jgi:hypothetical protein
MIHNEDRVMALIGFTTLYKENVLSQGMGFMRSCPNNFYQFKCLCIFAAMQVAC